MYVTQLEQRINKMLTGHMIIKIRKWYQSKELSKTPGKLR